MVHATEHVMISAQCYWRIARRCTFTPLRRYYSAVESKTKAFNAVVHVQEVISEQPHDEALEAPPASLRGRMIAIKDNIVTDDLPTTAGSHILEGYTSPFDSTVVKLLRQNGASIVAKTNLDEFGMGSHSRYSAAGPVYSPFSRGGRALSAGGSSGGSAVAVVTGQSWAALGTDTGGSVRLPAAYTGIVGFKPSYGLLSRFGVIQYANSLDTVGVLAKTARDAIEVFEALDAYDAQDPTSLLPSVRERIRLRKEELQVRRLRIGVPIDYNVKELSPVVHRAFVRTLKVLQAAGHVIRPVSLASTRHALSAYYVLAPAEASSNLAKYDGIRYGYRTSGRDSSPKDLLPLYAPTRGEGFGSEVKRRILLGAYTLSSEAIDNYFIQAQKVRRLVQQDFDRVFARRNPLLNLDSHSAGDAHDAVDLLVAPTAPTLPPTVEEVEKQTPVESYVNDIFTVPASLAGLPAISVPVPLSAAERQGMEETDVSSVGIQWIGQFGDDAFVLEAAHALEAELHQ